jgi:hypothetical protein
MKGGGGAREGDNYETCTLTVDIEHDVMNELDSAGHLTLVDPRVLFLNVFNFEIPFQPFWNTVYRVPVVWDVH